MGDVSSDELEDDQDSDEEEEFAVRKLDLQVAEIPLSEAAEPEKQAKRSATVKEDHKIALTKMGANFTIRYRFLDLKSNPEFRDQSQAYKDNLRNWYNYNWKQRNGDREVKIPKVLNPNEVLAGLFRDEDVDYRMGNYLAGIIEKYAEKHILASIAAEHVKKAVRRIDDINDAKKVMLTVGALWGPI